MVLFYDTIDDDDEFSSLDLPSEISDAIWRSNRLSMLDMDYYRPVRASDCGPFGPRGFTLEFRKRSDFHPKRRGEYYYAPNGVWDHIEGYYDRRWYTASDVYYLRRVKDYDQRRAAFYGAITSAPIQAEAQRPNPMDRWDNPRAHMRQSFSPAPRRTMQAAQACDLEPTPAPASIMGTCGYYRWRYNDFVKRHKGCDHLTPPDYYLDYGYKYCERFSTVLYPKLSNKGKEWLVKTRLYLQQDLEKLLKEKSDIELNNDDFRDAVFQTHPDAYMKAGFGDLTYNDTYQVLITPDWETWLHIDALEQIVVITWMINKNIQVKMQTSGQEFYSRCLDQRKGQGKYFICSQLKPGLGL